MQDLKETDLYPGVKRFLERQGYVVKSEIKGCDIVAIRGEEAPVIVELKIGFTVALLLQGIDRLGLSDAVYLAIAEPRRAVRHDLVKLCRRVGLGLLTVRGQSVEAVADPVPYLPRADKKRKNLLLKEFMARDGDPNSGGSTRRPLMTAYRQDALRVAGFLVEHGAMKVSHITKGALVDRAGTILLDNVYGWFERERRGVYGLTEQGKAALSGHSPLL